MRRTVTDSLEKRISLLPGLNKSELSELWEGLFRKPAPKLRKPFLVRILAYRLQEEAFGGLSATSLRRLRELAKTFEADANANVSSRPSIKPGTRLVRQWKHQVHVVDVEARGYAYRGVCYESLSEIARLITGTRWSGPLFFGLKTKQPSSPRKAA